MGTALPATSGSPTYDGADPRLYSSPDAVTWTQQPQLFTTFSPTTNAGWAVHFQGTDVIAVGYNAGDTVRYYRNGTLNGDGTVTWTGVAWVEETGPTDTVLFSLVGGGANCAPLTTSETSSMLTVTGAGAFEMTFDTVAGGSVKELYDLGEDPAKSNDLVGGVGATPQGLHTMGMQVAGTFYDSSENDSGASLHVLEATPTRVRVRSHGYLEDAGPNRVLGGVQVNGSYSVYPSGKMALHWDRRVMKTINFDTEFVENFLHWTNGVPPLDGWSIFRQAGGGTGAPGDDDFILAQIEAAGARTDFLSILSKDWTVANGYDRGQPRAERRLELVRRDLGPAHLLQAERPRQRSGRQRDQQQRGLPEPGWIGGHQGRSLARREREHGWRRRFQRSRRRLFTDVRPDADNGWAPVRYRRRDSHPLLAPRSRFDNGALSKTRR